MTNWREYYEYGQRRHGAVHVCEGEPFGITPRQVKRKALAEEWERPYPAVFHLPGSSDGFWRRASGALACANEPREHRAVEDLALVGLWSAAYGHGLLPQAPRLPHLLVPHHRRAPAPKLIQVRRSRTLWVPEDVAEMSGLSCTSVARTIGDLANFLSTNKLRYLVLDALQRRLTSEEALWGVVERLGNVPGRRRLWSVLVGLGDRRPDSGFEWEVREGLIERGRYPHPGPFPWRCPDSVVVEIDIAFPRQWVAVECEGRSKYLKRRDFTKQQIRNSQVSDQWSVLWLDHQHWRSRREAVLDEVERRLDAADAGREPAIPAR